MSVGYRAKGEIVADEFEKNELESVVGLLSPYKGSNVAHLRVRDLTTDRITTKLPSLRVELLPRLRDLIDELIRASEDAGMVKKKRVVRF